MEQLLASQNISAQLCARFRVLNTNDHAAPDGEVISSAFLSAYKAVFKRLSWHNAALKIGSKYSFTRL
jgi:hypothetical protein